MLIPDCCFRDVGKRIEEVKNDFDYEQKIGYLDSLQLQFGLE